MRFVLERVTEPDIEPVTLAEMKRHLREYDSVTTNDNDITALIGGARRWVEHETGRALIDQEWRLSVGGDTVAVDAVTTPYCGDLPTLHGSEIFLMRSPVIAIVSFKSVDSEGVETDVDSDTYELRDADSKWPRIVARNGASWATGLYRIVFRAGFADRDSSPQQDASVVPECFKLAMKLWTEATYDRDEKMMEKLLEVAAQVVSSERCHLNFA